MTTYVAFNVNSKVKVKLTEKGRSELKHQAEELRKVVPSLSPYQASPVDDQGYTTMQAWQLLHDLGHLCSLGMLPPFQTDILVEIDDNCLLDNKGGN